MLFAARAKMFLKKNKKDSSFQGLSYELDLLFLWESSFKNMSHKYCLSELSFAVIENDVSFVKLEMKQLILKYIILSSRYIIIL